MRKAQRSLVGALFTAVLAAGSLAAGVRPLVSVLGTCSTLATGTYPADTQNWFDSGRNAQIVYYAYLLVPIEPGPDETQPEPPAQPWHPPLATPASTSPAAAAGEGGHYAEAEWLDPNGGRLAEFGMTFTARARADWVTVAGRDYAPHTFAMAIGTRDVRADAGQLKIPSMEGQYTVRLRVDGRSVGLTFFRMLKATAVPAATPAAAPTPVRTATPLPSLPALKLP